MLIFLKLCVEIRHGGKPRIAEFDAICHSSIYKYFRFGLPYYYFRLSVVLAITFFELAMVENARVQLETNAFVAFLLKLVRTFLPQAQHMRVKVEYEG